MSNLTKAEFIRSGADTYVYIATPATSIASNFHVSLVREIPRLIMAGHSVTYAHLAGHCHVDDARNLLVHDFLQSGATDMLWWDADVACEPGASLKLLKSNVDIVGGIYPLKESPTRFPVRLGVAVDGGRLYEAESLPTGFLRVSRDVFWPLVKNAQTMGLDGQMVPIIFERGSVETEHGLERVGGDANFCRKATAAGFKLYCDPTIIFTHQGPVDFAGRLADHLGAKE